MNERSRFPGKDFFVVLSVVLGLGLILTLAMAGNTQKKLEDKLDEIYETSQKQGGWIFIEEFKEME